MAATKKKEEPVVTTGVAVLSEEALQALAQLNAMFPQGDTFSRASFPKLVFKSQDKFEPSDEVDEDGEPKLAHTVKAGTFFLEKPTDEKDENGKAKWEQSKLGKELSGHIIFHRKKLQYWDAQEEEFYSTPMFDQDYERVPLFKAGQFVAEGTPAELKALYPKVVEYTDKKTGEKKTKTVSHLDDAKILYVIVDGEMLELTLRGSSMWSFNDYLKKNAPQAAITAFSSTKEEAGSNKWNKMAFKVERQLTAEEAISGAHTLAELQEGIAAEKAFYASKRQAEAVAGDVYEGLPAAPLAIEGTEEELPDGHFN